jgi:tetratricopeptide (TPR) repeat protein
MRSPPGTLAQLRRLAASFALSRPAADERAVRRIAAALGPAAVPTCLRELAGGDASRRRWASTLLAEIAREHRIRVVKGIRDLLAGEASDEAKIDGLGLLAELGEESAPTRFADPAAIQRRSVEQLADHLRGPAAEVASTAEMVLHQLPPDDLLDLVEALADSDPERAIRLIDELLIRLDVDAALRSDLRRIAAPLRRPRPALGHPGEPLGRPSLLAVLADDTGRTVVAVCRRGDGPRQWRGLSVLIDDRGVLVDAVHDDDCSPQRMTARVIAPLRADGYHERATPLASVRRLVGDAARRAAAAGKLPAGYYLGRDLLALGDVHVAGRELPDEHATLLGRAVDLLALGEIARARPLLERCTAACPDDAEAVSSLGLCLLAEGDAAAAATWLDRAVLLDPSWPLHHWNAAAAAHRAGRTGACYLALRAFVELAASAPPAAQGSGHEQRVELARRFLADYERMCRLDGEDPAARASAERRRALRPRRARRSGAPAGPQPEP